jgi:putative heme-binding domain-containing protein
MQRFFAIAFTLATLVGALGATLPVAAQAPKFQLNRDDCVAIIGNTLADRMQHDAWLETYIYALHPEHDLVFRNLGYPGDELKERIREESFGSPDQWLTKVKADVVFCFFGYNEALKGDAGLDGFRKDLGEVIDGMLAQKYNGESAPRLVFFSPIAHENVKSPHLPDGSANNASLAKYTAAMREICQAKSIPFVDLFTPTQRLYETAKAPLTINGIHLSEDGGRELARVIAAELFGSAEPKLAADQLAKLRDAIQQRNYEWFSRYRVVDGYNVFGGRSKLAWFGQSNADVMIREMEIFDVKTANRDRLVWATARGSEHIVKDDNLPPELAVQTNKPGDRADGSFTYLGGEAAISKMKVGTGMKINLFASEEMFPELIKPVQMAVGPDGHLYASVWPSYPHWNPTKPRTDRIISLRDDNGDGVADKCVIFADELNSVTGFEFWGGGMIVAALPELWFLKDTDGDGKADYRVRMLQGMSSADSHHSANAMLLGPDGWLYWSRGIFNIAAIETPTKTFRSGASGVHRFNPRTFEMEFHFPIGPNPHGDVFDQWGYQFANDGTSGTGSYVNIGKGIANKQWFEKRVRPVAATGLLSSSHFPPENQGNFLICNTIGVLGVLQHKIEYNGADIVAKEIEPIVLSDDPNFRPSDVEIGADGALYISDWQNAIIGHMQHNMRDPNRDDKHGRIYRVTYPGRPLVEPVRFVGKSIQEVCNGFYAKENATRYRARIELSGRKSEDVLREVNAWAARCDVSKPDDAQALLECLWVMEEHRMPQPELLATVFKAAEPRVRAAAIRTLGHWSKSVPQWRQLLLAAAADESPLVRAEAVKSAVEFPADEAAEAIFVAATRPTDPELDAVLKFASNQMSIPQQLEKLVAGGKALSPAATSYAVKNGSPEVLKNLPPSAEVFDAILSRQDVPADVLGRAIDGIAKLKNADALGIAMQMLATRDQGDSPAAVLGVGQWLASRPPATLAKVVNQAESLAADGKHGSTRQIAFNLLMTATDSGDRALSIASRKPERMPELLTSIGSVPSEGLRAKLYPIVRSIINGSAASAGSDLSTQSGLNVDYFEPEPANVAIETLAALKPAMSGVVPQVTLDVPKRPRTEHYALRLSGSLDVPKAGNYNFFLSSDDGSRLYIDNKMLINHDGPHGMDAKSAKVDLPAGRVPFTLTYMNITGGFGLQLEWAGPGVKREVVPAARFFTAGGEDSLQQVAIRTLSRIPGYETEKWNDLTSLIKSGQSRAAAISILKSIPDDKRPGERLGDLADNLVAYLSDMPAALRTGPAAAEAIELVRSLATRLPKERADELAKRLDNLDVRVIAIGTVQERMIFDKEQIAIQAGRPVEFRFSNSDFMPHNFVIVQQGALQEIGEMAEATALAADAKTRHYVPTSPKVMLASRLLESNQSQSLLFEAPKEPGIYPYVCTYPGHWRRMYGALYVVADLEQYNADPAGYLAANPMEFKDELLKFISRNTEWKYDDLIGKVATLPEGRSFEVGRNLFKVANCVACHQFGGEGYALGPDLTKMEPDKQTVQHILRSIVEPSQAIDDKYRSYAFLLDSGKLVTGTVVEENDDVVKILTDPLNVREPTVLSKDEIEERSKSQVSIMPAGLLNKLTEEEIVDLVAYIVAKGDKKNPIFGHDHDH